ncbi:hypothetical protein F5Y15DRAFT_126110 [Xylariaceae sp. FL0016]|nr:hypothetical protein F5Y15DRAFT_126110 [Xylariaceae sp. FL0016]
MEAIKSSIRESLHSSTFSSITSSTLTSPTSGQHTPPDTAHYQLPRDLYTHNRYDNGTGLRPTAVHLHTRWGSCRPEFNIIGGCVNEVEEDDTSERVLTDASVRGLFDTAQRVITDPTERVLAAAYYVIDVQALQQFLEEDELEAEAQNPQSQPCRYVATAKHVMSDHNSVLVHCDAYEPFSNDSATRDMCNIVASQVEHLIMRLYERPVGYAARFEIVVRTRRDDLLLGRRVSPTLRGRRLREKETEVENKRLAQGNVLYQYKFNVPDGDGVDKGSLAFGIMETPSRWLRLFGMIVHVVTKDNEMWCWIDPLNQLGFVSDRRYEALWCLFDPESADHDFAGSDDVEENYS